MALWIHVALLLLHTFSIFVLPIVSATRHGEVILQKLAAIHDFQPQGIVDVGANRGTWSERARVFFPNKNSTSFLLLEGSEQHRSALEQATANIGNAEYRISLLSGCHGTQVAFFDGGDTGNSIFREDTTYFEKDEPINRTTSTLDYVVQTSSVMTARIVDLVKIDVQGAELLVLEGAHDVLEQATFLQLEISNVHFNVGGACGWEIHNLLHRYGFVLYDIGDVLYGQTLFKTSGIGQYDVLYVKPDSPRLPGSLQRMTAKYCPLKGPDAADRMSLDSHGNVDSTSHRRDSNHKEFDEPPYGYMPSLQVHLHSFAFGVFFGLFARKCLVLVRGPSQRGKS